MTAPADRGPVTADHGPVNGESGELLDLLADGRPEVGLQAFDRYGDRLFDFALAITRDTAAAAEIVRDVVVLASAVGPAQVAPLGSVRLWLYAQVRGQAFDWLAARGRLTPEARVIALDEVGPERTAGDLGNLAWQALAAYGERDQALVTLHLRHGLEGERLAHAMGLSTVATERLLAASLERVADGITALLVLGDQRCDGEVVEEVRDRWDGTFSPMVRRMASDLAADAGVTPVPDPLGVLQAVPLVPAPMTLREAVVNRLDVVLAHTPAEGMAVTDVDELDDTIPPEAGLPPVPAPAGGAATGAGAAHGATIGTDTGPQAPVEDPAEAEPVAAPADAPAAADPADEAAPVPVGRRRTRVPTVLSIGVGAAAALLVAAIIATVVLDRPAEEVVLPPVATQPVPTFTQRPSSTAVAATGVATSPDEASEPAASPAPSASADPQAPPAIPSPTPGATPTTAGLVVPTDQVVVGSEGSVVVIGNPGDEEARWTIRDAPAWLTTDPPGGLIAPGAGVEVTLTRSEDLAEGDHSGVLVLGVDGQGDGVPIGVVTAVDHPPVLEEVGVGSRVLTEQGCGLDSTEVAVSASDESAIVRVVLVLTGPGEGDPVEVVLAADDQEPGRWTGVAGPFTAAGTVTMAVRATDARGNIATADAGELGVAPCPTGADIQ